MTPLFLFYLLAVNVITFFVYGIDKWKAQNGRWRIPELSLMGFALAGGFLGAFVGMHIWHHKTRKPKFYIGVPLIAVFWIAVLAFMVL